MSRQADIPDALALLKDFPGTTDAELLDSYPSLTEADIPKLRADENPDKGKTQPEPKPQAKREQKPDELTAEELSGLYAAAAKAFVDALGNRLTAAQQEAALANPESFLDQIDTAESKDAPEGEWVPVRDLLRALAIESLNEPPTMEASTHPKPIVPHVQTRIEFPSPPPERERGLLLTRPGVYRDNTQLPLFGGEQTPGSVLDRVPLLGISDATNGGAVVSRGRGAPLELALPIAFLLAVRAEDRGLESVRIAVTVRQLRDWLYPNGWRRQHDWPRLQQALEGLSAQWVPLHGGKWFPVVLRYIPGDSAHLDELIVVEVAFPPGAHQGTPINQRRLSELRVHSGGAYRALIATSALAYLPGITRVKQGKRRWGWSDDPAAYPILTRQDRHDIVFGASSKRRTDAEVDKSFSELEKVGDILIVRGVYDQKRHANGDRIIPVEAASDKLRERLS